MLVLVAVVILSNKTLVKIGLVRLLLFSIIERRVSPAALLVQLTN